MNFVHDDREITYPDYYVFSFRT